MSKVSDLDSGLQYQFVHLKNGKGVNLYTGQIVGIYNEKKFLWNPTEFTTVSVFICTDKDVSLDSIR